MSLSASILSLQRLPAGSYDLIVEEAAEPQTGMVGCVYFELYVKLEDADADFKKISVESPPLPATMNRLPFILYNGETNMQGPVTLYDPVTEMTITPETKSTFRFMTYATRDSVDQPLSVSARSPFSAHP